MVSKKYFVKNEFWVPKKCGPVPKKICVLKKNPPQKCGHEKKFPKNVGPNKTVGPEKSVGPKRNVGPRKIFVPKKLWSQKFGAPK